MGSRTRRSLPSIAVSLTFLRIERDGKPGSLFWMWAGSILNVLPITFGALLPLIGLSFTQSIIIAIVGNLSWLLVGLASQSGPDAGTTALMISRAPFGQNGNRFVGVFQWLALLGFEASFMVVTVQAGLALAEKAGADPGDGLKAVIIIIAGLLLPIIALYGHATIVRVLGGLSVVSVVFFAIVAIIVIPKAHPSAFGHGASWGTVAIGLSIIVSARGSVSCSRRPTTPGIFRSTTQIARCSSGPPPVAGLWLKRC